MTYEKATELASRNEAFMATVYAMNTLLIDKGIYTKQEYRQLFTEWVEKRSAKRPEKSRLFLDRLTLKFRPKVQLSRIRAFWFCSAVVSRSQFLHSQRQGGAGLIVRPDSFRHSLFHHIKHPHASSRLYTHHAI